MFSLSTLFNNFAWKLNLGHHKHRPYQFCQKANPEHHKHTLFINFAGKLTYDIIKM